jgi:hypothetical protein
VKPFWLFVPFSASTATLELPIILFYGSRPWMRTARKSTNNQGILLHNSHIPAVFRTVAPLPGDGKGVASHKVVEPAVPALRLAMRL